MCPKSFWIGFASPNIKLHNQLYILKLGPINPGDDDYYTHYYQFSQMVDEDG